MLFMEFFTGKGRPKITVSFFQQGDDMGPELCGKSIIGAFAAPTGNQALSAFSSVTVYQAFYLPDRDPRAGSGLFLGDISANSLLNNLKSVELLMAHRHSLFEHIFPPGKSAGDILELVKGDITALG
ncbi:hypothetical protein NGUA07_03365 [Salmonella enterica]|nr:hypothetical protein NGUA07_03365 [Salmonella enterica]GAR40400.1 hypothetical protein NGUA10_04482 [Salmonella enterica]